MTAVTATNAELHARLRELVARMDALQRRCERAHDSRAVFTYVYSIMTGELDGALDGMDLRDAHWLVKLAEVFACRYFEAVEAFDAGESPGPAWQAVFEAIAGRSSVLEDAVYPITAHIVHDLPLALLDVGFDGPSMGSRLHDYNQVNQLMERSIDEIRRRVTRRYSPMLRFLDRMEGNYDLVLSSYGVRMSRGQAWYDALLVRDPSAGPAARLSLEERPVELIRSVRQPASLSVGLLLAALRSIAALFRRWPRPGQGA